MSPSGAAALTAVAIAGVLCALVAAGFQARAGLRHRLHGDRSAEVEDGARLHSFLRPYRGPLGLASLLAVSRALFDLARPWPLKFAVDSAISHRPLASALRWLGGLSPSALVGVAATASVVIVAADAVVGYLAEHLVGAAGELVGVDLRDACFAKLQRLSLRFHDGHRSGDLVQRLLSDTTRIEDALVATFDTLLPELVMLAGMLVIVFAIDVQLGLAALSVTPVLAVVAIVGRRRTKAAQRRARDLYGALGARTTELLRHVRVIQAFARHDEEDIRFHRTSAAMARGEVDALDVEARYAPATDVLLAIGGAFVLWLGVEKVISGRLTLGTLLVVVSYVGSLYGPIRSLARLASILARGSASAERIGEILDARETIQERPGALPAPVTAPAIRLEGVRFEYHRGHPVLADLWLEVPSGQVLCVVGPSGAGKSTLLAILLRLYDPSAGRVTFDGLDLRDLSLASLRERIALVPQDAWIVDGTIGENIAFGRVETSSDDIGRAGRLAHVEEFVARMPDGYDTRVGEDGRLLSGGQRRRLAIARAVARPSSLLLLDEPTSGLDAAAQASVLAALRSVTDGRTVVIASHDPAVAAMADRVVVLDSGLFVDQSPVRSHLQHEREEVRA